MVRNYRPSPFKFPWMHSNYSLSLFFNNCQSTIVTTLEFAKYLYCRWSSNRQHAFGENIKSVNKQQIPSSSIDTSRPCSLQSAMGFLQIATAYFIKKCNEQLTQIVTVFLLQCATWFITNCNRYCKVLWLWQIATVYRPLIKQETE